MTKKDRLKADGTSGCLDVKEANVPFLFWLQSY